MKTNTPQATGQATIPNNATVLMASRKLYDACKAASHAFGPSAEWFGPQLKALAEIEAAIALAESRS